MRQLREVDPRADFAIASPITFRKWVREMPALQETAVYDASGRLTLSRPREAHRSVEE